MADILGIECEIDDEPTRSAIERILSRICDQHPGDWDRIRSRVRAFLPLPESERDTIAGRWLVLTAPDPWAAEHYTAAGVILLREPADIAFIAHELGHAVGTEMERYEREAPDEEWGAESVANMHAFRWLAEEETHPLREHLSRGHIGILPGEEMDIEITEGDQKRVVTYGITDDFRYERVAERSGSL
jgi:hypothetical protein